MEILKKVLDNNIVTSMGKEVTCVDLLGLVNECYDLVVTRAVLKECENSRNPKLYARIESISSTFHEDEEFHALAGLVGREFRIAPGESECIAASILLTRSGIENYLVTDDSRARKVIKRIHLEPHTAKIAGFKIRPINCTGTVGLVLHLRDKGVLSKDVCRDIAQNLEENNSWMSNELLDLLR